MWMFHFSLPGIHPLIESTAASTSPIMINFGFILLIFWINLSVLPSENRDISASKNAAKLQQKVYYIQILEFIFDVCKKLKYNTMRK